MSYREENGRVVLTLLHADYCNVLLALGIAANAMSADGEPTDGMRDLLNRLNEGNPDFLPYQVKR